MLVKDKRDTTYEDALCRAFNLHFGAKDVFNKTRVAGSGKAAVKSVLLQRGVDVANAEAVNDAYTRLVVDTAKEILPPAWMTVRVDEFGGLCLTDLQFATSCSRRSVMNGEHGRFCAVSSFKGMVEELNRYTQGSR